MIALPVLPTPAAHDTPDRDTPPPVAIADGRRISELGADDTRLHRLTARGIATHVIYRHYPS